MGLSLLVALTLGTILAVRGKSPKPSTAGPVDLDVIAPEQQVASLEPLLQLSERESRSRTAIAVGSASTEDHDQLVIDGESAVEVVGLAGRCISTSGRAIPHVRVVLRLADSTRQRAETDDEGRFVFPGSFDGPLAFEEASSRWTPVEPEPSFHADGTETTFVLQRSGALRGQVDPESIPDEATLWQVLTQIEAGACEPTAVHSKLLSARLGRIRFVDLTPGTYLYAIRGTDGVWFESETFSVRPGTTASPPELQDLRLLELGERRELRLLDAYGVPMSDAQISIERDGDRLWALRTDELGWFELPDIGRTDLVAVVQAEGHRWAAFDDLSAETSLFLREELDVGLEVIGLPTQGHPGGIIKVRLEHVPTPFRRTGTVERRMHLGQGGPWRLRLPVAGRYELSGQLWRMMPPVDSSGRRLGPQAFFDGLELDVTEADDGGTLRVELPALDWLERRPEAEKR